MPLLPGGGVVVWGIAETAPAGFVGGRAAQAALNVVRGEEWSANLLNPRDIAPDVGPGVTAATWRTTQVGACGGRACAEPVRRGRGWESADASAPGRGGGGGGGCAARAWGAWDRGHPIKPCAGAL